MGTTGAVGLGLGAGAVDAYGAIDAGIYAKKLAGRNADIANAQAQNAIMRGAEASVMHRGKVRGLIATQRASYAGQGVRVDSGAAADVQASAEKMAALDELTIANNAALEAWGYRAQASDAKAKGAIAYRQGFLSAGGSLITAGANAAMYYDKHSAPASTRTWV